MKTWSTILPAVLFAGSAWAQGVYDKMGPDMGAGLRNVAKAEKTHWAKGVVKSVNVEKGEAMISHEAVQSLGWPAMTMSFRVRDRALLGKFTPGKKVEFELAKQGQGYVVVGAR
ncbi:MAG: copper-binding protein [Pseudomonadota bacterium]